MFVGRNGRLIVAVAASTARRLSRKLPSRAFPIIISSRRSSGRKRFRFNLAVGVVGSPPEPVGA
jgi:hypothetical protein